MASITARDLELQTPAGIIVCGPTMSGKTHYVFNMIKNQSKIFSHSFSRTVYCYGEWQTLFESVSNVEFIHGLQPVFQNEDFFDAKDSTLLIIDDLAVAACNDPHTSKLFTQGIHHRNLTIVFILQNLYKQGKSMRDITLNAQYLILFRNVRDVNQIKLLSRQMGLPHLSDAYNKVTAEHYQPLLVDMRPNTKDYLRIRSHILPNESPRLYVKQGTLLPCLKE